MQKFLTYNSVSIPVIPVDSNLLALVTFLYLALITYKDKLNSSDYG